MTEIEMIVVNTLGFLAATAFVIWVVVTGRHRSRRVEAVTEFHNKLLDKLGSARDFSDFLQSEGGERFLESLTVEKVSPRQRILSSLQTGTILLLVGLGLMGLEFTEAGSHPPFRILGNLGIFLGLGFLVSSVVSYQLSRRWGLLEGRRLPEGGTRETS